MNDASAIKHEGSTAYNAMKWATGGINRMTVAPSMAMLGIGVVSGQAHQITGPAWDYWQNRDARNAEEVKLKAAAEAKYQQEQKDLDAAQARMNAQSAGASTAVSANP